MNIYKRLIAASLLLCLMFTFISTPIVQADNLVATTDENTAGIGDYSVTLSTTESELYNVTLAINRKSDDGTDVSVSDEVYFINVTNADGTVNEEKSGYYRFSSVWNNAHNHPELVATVPEVPGGSTLLVKNIKVEKQVLDQWGTPEWDNYRITNMATTVTNADASSNEVVLIEDEETFKQLIVGETVAQVAKTVDTSFDRVTGDTLLGLSGYSSYNRIDFLTYLLSSYNVVSLDEINSTHIVGPIISQNIAKRTTQNGLDKGFLAASDYSNGIPSYVGQFTSFGDNEVGVKFNYDFDTTKDSNFKFPFTYSEEDRLSIKIKGDVNQALDYYVLPDGTEVLSSNNGGQTETYQNNNFINFGSLGSALENLSDKILDNGNAESYPEFVRYEFDTDGTVNGSTIKVYEGGELVKTITSSNGESYGDRNFASFVQPASYGNYTQGGIRLNINMQESWTIKNADNLQEVNMSLPEGYDYYDNPYMMPTTINFECEYINPSSAYNIDVNGDGTKEYVKHSRMPYTLINGAEFDGKQGADGEYSEVGNKIIWNMPNLVTNSETGDNRLSLLERSHNIAGHIVAPQAEFWNYDENGGWHGGNLNGSAIVKSFYSGNMEMHMWAYSGLAEEAVVYGVKAKKTINGGEPNREYHFLLEPVYNEDGSIPSGILNTNFPLTASSRTDDGEKGIIKFSSLAFNRAGTYTFILKEDTSADTPTDNVDYDLTQYKIVIKVGANVKGDYTKYYIENVSKYKITDRDGNPITEEPVEGEFGFVFDNHVTEEGTVNLTFTKKSTSGHVLVGAKFYVTEMTSADNEARPEGGYFESITSDVNGHINIMNLKKNTYYKFWEYEPPHEHNMSPGYWILYVGPNGFLQSITPMDGAPAITDNIIYNEHEESVSLDVTLTKKNQMNKVLAGVNFSVQRVVFDENNIPQVVNGGYSENYITDENGIFTINNLEPNKVYMVKETSTPDLHIPHTGYWLITVTADPLHPTQALSYTIVEYDVDHNLVGNVSEDTLYNEKIEFKLPTTGGIGTTIYYVSGMFLMFFALVLYKKAKARN